MCRLVLLALLCAEWLEITSLALWRWPCPFMLTPVPLLARLRARGERPGFLLRAYPVLLTVIITWLAGVLLSGSFSAPGGFVDGNRKRRTASAAPDQ